MWVCHRIWVCEVSDLADTFPRDIVAERALDILPLEVLGRDADHRHGALNLVTC